MLCLFGGSGCKKYSYISQGDCAGGQVPEEMGEERQAARQGSPAQLPLVCGLVFIATDRSGGRRQTDWCIQPQEGSEGATPFLALPGCGEAPSTGTLNTLCYMEWAVRAQTRPLTTHGSKTALSSFLIEL